MNTLLSSLAEVCKKHLLDEKILVAPSLRAGRQLCEALARGGGGWVNLRPKTAAGLARRVAGAYLTANSIKVIGGFLTATVMEVVFRELEEKGKLSYFARRGKSPGLTRAITSSCLELRSCGVSAATLPENAFVSPVKGRDMVALLQAYEGYLAEHGYVDAPGLVALALRLLRAASLPGDAVYLLPDCLRPAPLEARLIETMAAGRLVVLPAGHVYGPDSSGADPAKDPATDSGRLPWLYRPDLAPPPVKDGSLRYFQAYGLRNEVREVYRRLLADNIPLDQVIVACTGGEYIPAFYTLSKRLGLGLTVAGGLPATMTSPGQVLRDLVDWARSEFSTTLLKDLLLGGDVRAVPGEGAPAPAEAVRLLRQAGIGRGRDRYILLKELAAGRREKAALEVEDVGRRERLLQQSRQAGQVYYFTQTLLAAFPATGDFGQVDFRELTSGLAQLLPELVLLKDETDADALRGLVEILVQAGQLGGLSLTIEEALERVEHILEEFRAGTSGPKPGCLHLTGYDNLIYADRPNTFVVGLGADSFPGMGRQDPVLLDEERRRIHPGLPLGAGRPGANQYTLTLALASRRGRVALSFSSFNVAENRAAYPSPLLLQAHRLLQGDPAVDYTGLLGCLGRAAGYCPPDGQPALDEVEWWAGKILAGPGIAGGPAAVRSCYRNLDLGLRALEARLSAEPTEYDGIIGLGVEFDPRQRRDLVMSCSRIEYLAGCPFAYFLRYVLRVHKPEEVTYDPGRWLEPAERGLLLHQLFCDFMKQLVAEGRSPDPAADRPLILALADSLIDYYRKMTPPPGDVIFSREVNDIYQCCDIFLAAEAAHAGGAPVLFEVPFGCGQKTVAKAGAGLAGPVEVELDPGSWFLLQGVIDRIDQASDGTYHVWDYKTGSLYGYEDHQYLCGGRQVQHALYALAAERILAKVYPGALPRVEVAGYYFPTVKGEGRRVTRQQGARGPVTDTLGCLFDLLAGGVFIAADHQKMCGICDYPEVCGGASDRSKKLVTGSASCLDPWRRLKEYE